MKIPQHLPQFKDRVALLVVTGRKVAHLYLASNGKLERVEHIKEEHPPYEDKEGFSRHFTISGSVREPQDDVMVQKFAKKLAETVKRVDVRFRADDVYLFTPKTHELAAHWETDQQKKIRHEVRGEFIHESPLMVLERLQRSLEGRTVEPAAPSYVRRLLNIASVAKITGLVKRGRAGT